MHLIPLSSFRGELYLMFVGVNYSKISAVGVTLGDFYT